MAYPLQQSTVVITQQPTAMPKMDRPWGSGLCACFDDCGICLLATFIPNCYQCAVMENFNENCCVAWPCLLGPNGSLLALRYHFRKENNIEGTLMKDCFAVMFCYQCSLCQLMREHERMKYQVGMAINSSIVVTTVPQTAPPVMSPSGEMMGYDQ